MFCAAEGGSMTGCYIAVTDYVSTKDEGNIKLWNLLGSMLLGMAVKILVIQEREKDA
jgi:hypothetical protein